ncbi:unnamed protein product [Pleuronectes platessa]|uniref:Uncharacterized protein n=1 Tax=Pleuronectes platessa TaxID=8262 RepID=A0A9N7YGK1_PLEPL|nr:unnamed protein product [Pleuronectes platessa]
MDRRRSHSSRIYPHLTLEMMVVLPALFNLVRIMEISDVDPAYIVRFRAAFTEDLNTRQENTNLSWLKSLCLMRRHFPRTKLWIAQCQHRHMSPRVVVNSTHWCRCRLAQNYLAGPALAMLEP